MLYVIGPLNGDPTFALLTHAYHTVHIYFHLLDSFQITLSAFYSSAMCGYVSD